MVHSKDISMVLRLGSTKSLSSDQCLLICKGVVDHWNCWLHFLLSLSEKRWNNFVLFSLCVPFPSRFRENVFSLLIKKDALGDFLLLKLLVFLMLCYDLTIFIRSMSVWPNIVAFPIACFAFHTHTSVTHLNFSK